MHDMGQLNKLNIPAKKLKALDRLAARSTTTITRNTPEAIVEVMIDLMPIELMIQKTGIFLWRPLSRLGRPTGI